MRSLFCGKLPKLFVPFLVFAWCLAVTASGSDGAGDGAPPTDDPMLGQKAGQVRDDNGVKMKLVWCPRGFVTMEEVEIDAAPVTTGEEDEAAPKTRRVEKLTPVKVLLTRGYWIGKYEVTQSEWKQVMQTEPWKGKGGANEGADFPATFVSWNDATDFIHKLTEQERQAGRLTNAWEYTLPTEAQWERACRARTETRFSFGDDESKLGDYAWYVDNAAKPGEAYAHRVGQKNANPWGLCDMHGNVWEWCRDVYAERLPGGRDPDVKPDEKIGGWARTIRGGSWNEVGAVCRSGNREGFPPTGRLSNLGFRLVLSPIP